MVGEIIPELRAASSRNQHWPTPPSKMVTYGGHLWAPPPIVFDRVTTPPIQRRTPLSIQIMARLMVSPGRFSSLAMSQPHTTRREGGFVDVPNCRAFVDVPKTTQNIGLYLSRSYWTSRCCAGLPPPSKMVTYGGHLWAPPPIVFDRVTTPPFNAAPPSRSRSWRA